MKATTMPYKSFSRSVLSKVFVLLIWFSMTAHASAQATLNIAAVVNDDAISVYDLSQRIEYVALLSNLPRTAETQQRIAPDVLRRLIVEKLHLQEAERLGITVNDQAIDNAIKTLEKRNNLKPGSLVPILEQNGIDPETVREQMRAENAWIAVVRALFRGLVSVSDQEVDDILEEMKQNTGKPEYLLAEIFLAFDEKPASEVRKIASQVHGQLKNGADWQQMAINFSEAASARNGGDLGWVSVSELGSVLSGVVPKLQPGQMSSPVEAEDGVYLVFLRNVRTAKGLESKPADVEVSLQQLHLALPANADARTVTETTQQAQQLVSESANCKAFESIAKSAGSDKSGFLGKFKLEQLNSDFKRLVGKLKENEISQPLRMGDGIIVLMVCSRESQGGADPIAVERQKIKGRLLNERLARKAKQHEDQLRRQAFIDVRL